MSGLRGRSRLRKVPIFQKTPDKRHAPNGHVLWPGSPPQAELRHIAPPSWTPPGNPPASSSVLKGLLRSEKRSEERIQEATESFRSSTDKLSRSLNGKGNAGMINAQYEIATYIQYRQYRDKALEKRMEKPESGEAYQELRDKLHAANTRYDRMAKKKDSIIAACRSQAKRVRTIWFDEVSPDVVRTYERKQGSQTREQGRRKM